MQYSNVESPEGSNPTLRLFTLTYIITLLATEVSLFGLCVVSHISQLLRKEWGNHLFAETIMSAVLLSGLSVVPFVKDGMRWRNQVSLCPRWMWVSAIIFAAYGFTSLFWTPSLLEGGNGNASSDQARLMFVLGFETIPICVLYSALFKGVFSESEKVRRAFYSILMLVPFVAALILKSSQTIARHQ